MANDHINNADVKVLCTKIDGLTVQVGKLETNQDSYHKESQTRIVLAEKQLALMQQSYETICKDIDKNVKNDISKLKTRQDKNDMWTKIVGGIEALFTLVLAWVGINVMSK